MLQNTSWLNQNYNYSLKWRRQTKSLVAHSIWKITERIRGPQCRKTNRLNDRDNAGRTSFTRLYLQLTSIAYISQKTLSSSCWGQQNLKTVWMNTINSSSRTMPMSSRESINGSNNALESSRSSKRRIYKMKRKRREMNCQQMKVRKPWSLVKVFKLKMARKSISLK